MIGVTYEMKKMFFDRAKVQAALTKQRHKFLGNVGGYVRKTAIRSMRRVGKRGKPSRPGQPPKFHGDEQFSLRKILYGFDAIRQSVVIGPVKGNKKTYVGGVLLPGTVPNLHEFGGRVGIREKRVGSDWTPIGKRKARPGQPMRVRLATYPARPFMAPALVKAEKKFPGLWANNSSGEAA